jgi:hypothetical protein
MVITLIALLNGSVRAATFTVTSTADIGAGSLREALSNAANGDTVDATGVSGTILLTSGELLVRHNVTIVGPGPANLTVDGSGTNRVFHIHLGKTVVISGLTITNGFADYTNGSDGGGIFNDHAILTVSNCMICGNTVNGNGGGICNAGDSCSATLKISSSTISGNRANFGGGIFSSGVWDGSALVQIGNCTVSGNSADDSGGGIYNTSESFGAGELQIANCTISGNSAVEHGGGIFNNGANDGVATVEIGNTIIAGASGNNIENQGGTVTSRGFNLCSDDGGGLLTATSDRINTDPKLDPAGLQDNGGPTKTISLNVLSPAVDQGKRDTIPELATFVDQRGFQRRMNFPTIPKPPGGDASDIGALEVQTGCTDLTGSFSSVVRVCSTNHLGLVQWCRVIVKLNVRNIGTVATTPSVTRIYLSSDASFGAGDILLKQLNTPNAKPGGRPRLTAATTLLPKFNTGSGQYIIVVIDPDNTVVECDKSNNVLVYGPLP